MAMASLYAFDQLPIPKQSALELNEGTYLTMPFSEESNRITLYHLGSFFAEVYYDPAVNHLHRCRTLASTGLLDTCTG